MKQYRLALGIAAGLALLQIGCSSVSTKRSFYQPLVAELQAGKYDSVSAAFESPAMQDRFGNKDRFLYFVDAGMAHHYAGRFDSSNLRLELAELAAEELFTKSISRAAASLLLNDNVLEYAGEDYEILYSNLFKAMNYLLENDFDDAFVEIRRANQKLTVLEDKYAEAVKQLNSGEARDSSAIKIDYEIKKVRFHNDAFARWMSMHMYAAEGKFDDARLDYDYLVDAFVSQPHIYNFEMPGVSYSADSGKAVLSVVALAGLSPVKDDWSLRLRTDKDLDLVQVYYDDENPENTILWQAPVPINEDYYFKFAVPKLVDRPSYINTIRVYHNLRLLGELQLLEDVGSVARETFEAKKTIILIRSVLRGLAKGLAAHKLKEKADTGGLGGWLKKAAIDVATDLSENADLRCSRLLPGRIFVGDIQIEPGTYDLAIEFLDVAGDLVTRQSVTGYTVRDGEFNLVQAISLN